MREQFLERSLCCVWMFVIYTESRLPEESGVVPIGRCIKAFPPVVDVVRGIPYSKHVWFYEIPDICGGGVSKTWLILETLERITIGRLNPHFRLELSKHVRVTTRFVTPRSPLSPLPPPESPTSVRLGLLSRIALSSFPAFPRRHDFEPLVPVRSFVSM
jgi:hypothetical protein